MKRTLGVLLLVAALSSTALAVAGDSATKDCCPVPCEPCPGVCPLPCESSE